MKKYVDGKVIEIEKIIKLAELENYIREWYFNCVPLISESTKKPNTQEYKIYDADSGEILFVEFFGEREQILPETKVSTRGILDSKFRDMVEQCIMLDEQIKTNDEAQKATQIQKI